METQCDASKYRQIKETRKSMGDMNKKFFKEIEIIKRNQI